MRGAVGSRELVAHLERTWASDAAALVAVLAEQDPAWGSAAYQLSGGYVVLCGKGLYVNQALAVGFDDPLTDDEIDRLAHWSSRVDVPPAVETTSATHPETLTRLGDWGFVPVQAPTSALVLAVDPSGIGPTHIEIVSVSATSLADWQHVSALGWGHSTPSSRRAADAYARAAYVLDGEGMVIAVDAQDGRPLGCASLTVREGVATLGGMSTIPAERGRGAQSALIHHRIAMARGQGCHLITASAVAGSGSERNLIRHGFRLSHVKVLHVASLPIKGR